MGVKAIYFNVQDVGKHVKKSKKRFIWKFQVDRDEHVLEMFNSLLSGKKLIILDGRTIHEVQKVTSSFQFPFQIKGINCMIVQHGEQFELRINNQVFSHLYNQEKMKREFQFEGEGGRGDKGYGDEEEYGGNNDKYGGYGGNKRDEDRYEDKYESPFKSKQDTYQRSQTYGGTKVKGWDDEERNQKREEPKRKPYGSNDDDDGDTGFGFSQAFDKFGPTKSNQQQQQSRSNNNDPFESYSNKYSADQGKNRPQNQQNRGDFGFDQQPQKASQGFGGFDDFEQKPKQQQFQNAFDDFSAPPQRQQQQQNPSQQFQGFDSFNQQPKPQQKVQHANTVGASDLLDLDFGGGNQQQAQPSGGNQNAGGFDFFSQQQQQQQQRPPQQMNQPQGYPQQQQQQQQKNNTNLNDLMGLEFGNPGTSQGSNISNVSQPSSNMANFLDDAPPQQAQPQTQAQPQPQKKKDLWSTDLVSLDPSEALGPKKGNEYDYGNNAGYNRGPGNMGMSQPQYGGMGGMGGNMGGNMGYNAGYGGNYNTGMGMGGGNQYGGYNNNMSQGNMNQGMGGYGNNAMGGGMGMNAGYNQGNYGMGGAPQQSNVNVGGGANNASTPFDFDM